MSRATLWQFSACHPRMQVVEHMCEEIGHAISVARSADDLAAVLRSSKALIEMERLMAEPGAVPDPASNAVYASGFADSSVVSFDVRTGKVTATINMPEKMLGLGVDPIPKEGLRASSPHGHHIRYLRSWLERDRPWTTINTNVDMNT
jgi:hypothetical protein